MVPEKVLSINALNMHKVNVDLKASATAPSFVPKAWPLLPGTRMVWKKTGVAFLGLSSAPPKEARSNPKPARGKSLARIRIPRLPL